MSFQKIFIKNISIIFFVLLILFSCVNPNRGIYITAKNSVNKTELTSEQKITSPIPFAFPHFSDNVQFYSMKKNTSITNMSREELQSPGANLSHTLISNFEVSFSTNFRIHEIIDNKHFMLIKKELIPDTNVGDMENKRLGKLLSPFALYNVKIVEHGVSYSKSLAEFYSEDESDTLICLSNLQIISRPLYCYGARAVYSPHYYYMAEYYDDGFFNVVNNLTNKNHFLITNREGEIATYNINDSGYLSIRYSPQNYVIHKRILNLKKKIFETSEENNSFISKRIFKEKKILFELTQTNFNFLSVLNNDLNYPNDNFTMFYQKGHDSKLGSYVSLYSNDKKIMSIIIKDSIFSCSMISEKYILVNYSSEKSDIYSISGELVLNNIWTGKIKNIQSQKLDDNDIAILIGNSKLFLFSSDNKKMYEYLATDKYIKKIICYKKYIALLLWPKEKFSNFGLYDYQEVMVFSKDLKVIFYKRFYGWLHIGRSFLRNYCNFDFENEEFRLFNFHAVFHYRLIP